jgi:DNA polymerase-3 subunit beta
MKLTITREQFQEGLQAVAAAIPSKTTLPVLSNVLLEATSDGLRLSGTDLDIAVSTTVPASIDQEGAITLPAKKLSDLVREMPTASIRLTSSGEQRATIECGRAKFKLLGLSRDEFPAFPAVKFDGAWQSRSWSRTSPLRRAPRKAARSSTVSCGSCVPSGCGWSPPTDTGLPGWTCP